MGAVISRYSPSLDEDNEAKYVAELLRSTSIQLPNDVIVKKNFIQNWGNTEDLMWDVTFHSKGPFRVALGISNKEPHDSAEIEVEINGFILLLNITPEMVYEKCTKLILGNLCVKSPGFSTIRVRGKEKTSGSLGCLHFVELKGPAVENMTNHSWDKSFPLVASDVYLVWHTTSKPNDIDMFYNEIQVIDHNTDAMFIPCGFHRGYIGLKNGQIIFAIDNPSTKCSYSSEFHKIKNIKHIHDAKIEYDPGQKKGTCTYFKVWKRNETYRFVISVKHSKDENTLFYSAYYFRDDVKRWDLLATFKAPDFLKCFKDLYSSIEQCKSYHGLNNYQAKFGPAMIHVKGKGWAHLVKAQFQQREDEDLPTDVDANITDDNKFMLSTGFPAQKTVGLYESIACNKEPLPECLVGLDPDSICPD